MNIEQYDKRKADSIRALFTLAFSHSAGEEEGTLVGGLAYELITETQDDDIFCFGITEGDNLAGSIIFSRLTFESDINAFILSPVAIHPDHQRKGLGQKLIAHGIMQLKKSGVELVMTYGDPSYYAKVGFQPVSVEVVHPPFELTHPEGWIGQSLLCEKVEPIPGKMICVNALNNPIYW